jgi:hypothetical protein
LSVTVRPEDSPQHLQANQRQHRSDNDSSERHSDQHHQQEELYLGLVGAAHVAS